MKKFLASIIAVVLAVSGLSVISITANAATIFISGNYEYTVNSDDTVNIAGYKGIATDITIPSQILNKNVVKISDNSFLSPFPKEKVKKREVDELSALFKNRNIATRPPITPQIPKSSTPRAYNTTREVYNDTIIDIPIRIYRKIVFLAIFKFFSLIILLLRYRIMSPTIH